MPDEQRAWEVVLRHVERELLDGRLRPGDRLPGERALATDLGVGRSSVREALRVLEVLGLIRTHAGSGPNAGAIIIAVPGGGMSALMRLQVAAQGFPVGDIVKTRVTLESAVGAELASRFASSPARMSGADGTDPASPATPPDLSGAHELLDAMERPGVAPAEFLSLDQQFHLSLAEASGNQVITATMAGLRSSIEAYVMAGATGLPSWDATAGRLRKEHRGILTTIESGDPSAAATAITTHIETYYAETGLQAPTRSGGSGLTETMTSSL